jgi:hypothetical protein
MVFGRGIIFAGIGRVLLGTKNSLAEKIEFV